MAGVLVAAVRATVRLARVDDGPALEVAPVSVVDTVLVVPVEAAVSDAAEVVVVDVDDEPVDDEPVEDASADDVEAPREAVAVAEDDSSDADDDGHDLARGA